MTEETNNLSRRSLLGGTAKTAVFAGVAATAVGDYRDLATLQTFVDGADALTFDHEHVPTRHLSVIEGQVAVRPGPEALVYAQDKAAMRERPQRR